MDLREEVTEADALDAVAVVRETIIYDTLADLVGGANLHQGGGGGGGSDLFGAGGPTGGPIGPEPWKAVSAAPTKRPNHKKVAMDFISFLDHDANVRANALYSYKELQEAFDRSGLVNSRPTFREFVDAINLEGSILKRGGNSYLLPSSSYASSSQASQRGGGGGGSQGGWGSQW